MIGGLLGAMLELVSKELNHLAAILHVYAGGFDFYKVKKNIIIFQKEKGNSFTLLIILKVTKLVLISHIRTFAQTFPYLHLCLQWPYRL